MVSGTLNRDTDEIEKLRRALGNHCVGTFDNMPAHTPRAAVIAAAEQAREAKADLIVTLGGGSITDGAKAVQLCLANDVRTPEAMDAIRARTPREAADGARRSPIPTTLSAGEFSYISGVTDERTKVKELFRHADIVPRAVDPRSRGDAAHADVAVAVDRHPRRRPLRRGRLLQRGEPLRRRPGAARPRAAGARPAQGEGRSRPTCAARLDCQIGSWLSMAPLAAGVPMGASHGIGYVLGAVFDIPHGHTSCIMLPSVMRWNKSANADAPGAGRRRDGPSRQGRRRRARRLHPRPRHAAQPGRGEGRHGAFRPHRQAGHGHALGAAQPAPDRRAGAGEGDPGAGGLGRLELPQFPHFALPPCALADRAACMHCQQKSDFPAFPVFPTESVVVRRKLSPYGLGPGAPASRERRRAPGEPVPQLARRFLSGIPTHNIVR